MTVKQRLHIRTFSFGSSSSVFFLRALLAAFWYLVLRKERASDKLFYVKKKRTSKSKELSKLFQLHWNTKIPFKYKQVIFGLRYYVNYLCLTWFYFELFVPKKESEDMHRPAASLVHLTCLLTAIAAGCWWKEAMLISYPFVRP